MLGIRQHKNVYRILKSERINSLRKQYDAFLEEDKKRKERNEYILGRLDRMRISTALVPSRYQHIPFTDRRSVFYGLRGPESIPNNNNRQDIIVDNHQLVNDRLEKINDAYLIQEISNNYILIPKLRPTLKTNNYEEVPVNNRRGSMMNVQGVEESSFHKNTVMPVSKDNNWQSKYEILSTLKKEEKEMPTIVPQTTKCAPTLKYESPLNSNHEEINVHFDNDILTDVNIDNGNKYLNELPEKDISINKVSSAFENDSNTENINYNNFNNNNVTRIIANTADDNDMAYNLQNNNLEHNNSEFITHTPADEITNYAPSEQYNQQEVEVNNLNLQNPQINHAEHPKSINNKDQNTKQCVDINKKENVEIFNSLAEEPVVSGAQLTSADLKKEVLVDEQIPISPQMNNAPGVQEEISICETDAQPYLTDYVAYGTDVTNVDETISNIEYGMSDEYDPSAAKQHEIEPEHMAAADSREPPIENFSEVQDSLVEKEELVDDTGIEAFNTEQQAMFYAEQPAEQYGYEQSDVNNDEQGYPEQAENQNQEEYSYYDNMQPEAYPTDLGENEEQILRHDPSYEQQYVDTYEASYEQEQPQQYEVESNINPTQSQELEQIYDQQDNETTEQVESVLDNEEGYLTQNLDNNETSVEPQETNETNTNK